MSRDARHFLERSVFGRLWDDVFCGEPMADFAVEMVFVREPCRILSCGWVVWMGDLDMAFLWGFRGRMAFVWCCVPLFV